MAKKNKPRRFKKVVKHDKEYWMFLIALALVGTGYLFGIGVSQEFRIHYLWFPALLDLLWFISWKGTRKVYWEEEK